MPRIVDGDNLLGSWPGADRSASSRLDLVRRLRGLSGLWKSRVVVAFDGPIVPGIPPGPDVIFSEPGKSADDAILALLSAASDRRGWTVVTNDRALAGRARWLGASVERCDRFRSRMSDAPPAEKPDREEALGDWLRVFGEDGGPRPD